MIKEFVLKCLTPVSLILEKKWRLETFLYYLYGNSL